MLNDLNTKEKILVIFLTPFSIIFTVIFLPFIAIHGMYKGICDAIYHSKLIKQYNFYKN